MESQPRAAVKNRPAGSPARPWMPWVILGLTVLLVLIVRVRLREMPLERDEGEYAYAGQLILHGVAPYKEVYNMKLPGTYVAYAAIMGMLGQNASAIHLGIALVNVGSILLVYLIGRKLLDEVTGLVAAVSFAFLSLSPSVLGLAGHATHFVTLFALGGIYVLLRATDGLFPQRARPNTQRGGHVPAPGVRETYLQILICGLLLGLSFLMKQHGIFFGIFAGLYLLGLFFARWYEAQQEAKRAPVLVPAARQAIGEVRPGAKESAPAQKRLSHFAAGKLGSPKSEIRNPKEDRIPNSEAQAQSGKGTTPTKTERTTEYTDYTEEAGKKADAAVAGPKSEIEKPQSESRASVLQPSTLNAQLSPPSNPSTSFLPALGLLIAGFVLPYAVTCLVLWLAGVFPEFWFWTVSYAAQYASAIPLAQAPELLRAALRTVVGPEVLFWILPWAGALFIWWDEKFPPKYRFFIVALLFCSFASASVGLYYRGHYFIPLLPVLSLLSGLAVSRVGRVVRTRKDLELFVALPVLILFPVAILVTIIGNSSVWFAQAPAQASLSTYGSSIFSEAARAADFVQANASANARIAVLGSEPEIYFLSRHRAVTGHIYIYPLLERHEYARKMQDQMIAEIEHAQPEYVVFVDETTSWLRQPGSESKIYEWWEAYSRKNLEFVRKFGIEKDQAEETRRKRGPASAGEIMVYRKRTAPAA